MEAETKRKILKWIGISLACILCGLIFWYFSFQGQFHRYRDDMYKFSIKFPKAWAYKVHPEPGGAILFVAPKTRVTDEFTATINVAVQNLPPEVATLRDVTETVTKQMKATFTNLTIEQSVPAMLGSRKAWMMVFSTTEPEAIKIVTAWTIRDADKAYILTYLTKTPNHPKYISLFQHMMKTFKLIN